MSKRLLRTIIRWTEAALGVNRAFPLTIRLTMALNWLDRNRNARNHTPTSDNRTAGLKTQMAGIVAGGEMVEIGREC
jgi:hypothetical protein